MYQQHFLRGVVCFKKEDINKVYCDLSRFRISFNYLNYIKIHFRCFLESRLFSDLFLDYILIEIIISIFSNYLLAISCLQPSVHSLYTYVSWMNSSKHTQRLCCVRASIPSSMTIDNSLCTNQLPFTDITMLQLIEASGLWYRRWSNGKYRLYYFRIRSDITVTNSSTSRRMRLQLANKSYSVGVLDFVRLPIENVPNMNLFYFTVNYIRRNSKKSQFIEWSEWPKIVQIA